MNTLSKILSSKVRAEIFRVLFGISYEELHMREIERRTGFVIGTIQAELKKLIELDLVTKRRDGNRLYSSANRNNPLYPEIRNLVLKTIGLVDILKDALGKDPRISTAFIFGSLAALRESSGSDVDILIVGKLGLRDVSEMFSGVTDQIGREINPIVISEAEFSNRMEEQDHFFGRLMEEPKLFIIGSENDLAAMG